VNTETTDGVWLASELQRLADQVGEPAVPRQAIQQRVVALRRRHRAQRVVAGASACVLVAAALFVQHDRAGTPVTTNSGYADAPATTATDAPPTIVAPSTIPADFSFVEAGRVTHPSQPADVLVFSRQFDQHAIVSAGELTVQGGCSAVEGPEGGTQRDAVRAYRNGGRSPGQIIWCDAAAPALIAVTTEGLSRDAAADLASTVTLRNGVVALTPPEGFAMTRGPRIKQFAALLYQSRSAPARTFRIQMANADAQALAWFEIDGASPELSLGGRSGLVIPAGIVVQYDDHTAVIVSGTGVSRVELEAIAASLTTTDAPAVPPISFDSPACERLRLCG
jgi:hypothetical protein